MVSNEQAKESSSDKIRSIGREIQKTAAELSGKKRKDITSIISQARRRSSRHSSFWSAHPPRRA